MTNFRSLRMLGVFFVGWLAVATAPSLQAQVIYARASTIGESYLRGAADVIRSRAAANLSNSEAAINWEQARSMSYDNAVKYVETYFERKRINKEYRDAAKRPPPTREQFERWAKKGAPQTLTSAQYDSVTGAIAWPIVLRGPEFAKIRTYLERKFSQKAANGVAGMYGVQAIRLGVEECERIMRRNIDQYPPDYYMKSLSFLASLKYEVVAKRANSDAP